MKKLVDLLFEERSIAFKIDMDNDWDDISPEDAGLSAEIGEDKVGGVHAFHGWKMDRTDMKDTGEKSGPQFQKIEPVVTNGEIKHAINYILKFRPEELYVYSRGSAVWANVQEISPKIASIPKKVHYMAPAKLRTNWGANEIDLANKDGEVYAAPQDGKVPLVQAAKIAQDIGQSDLTLTDVEPRGAKLDNPDDFGMKGHQSMRAKKFFKSTKEIPVGDVLSADLPDWGDGSASKEDLEKQMKFAKEKGLEVSGLQEMRRTIRKLIIENASIADSSILNKMKDLNLIVVVDLKVINSGRVYLCKREDYDEEYQDVISFLAEFQIEPTDMINTVQIAWSDINFQYKRQGYGKLLYNVALAVISNNGYWLTADREEVSSDAQRIWSTWARHPELYNIEQLDYKMPQFVNGEYDPDVDYLLTPQTDDDIQQNSFENDQWKRSKNVNLPPEAFDEDGFEKEWAYFWDPSFKKQFLDSGLTKRFQMKDSISFIKILQDTNILYFM